MRKSLFTWACALAVVCATSMSVASVVVDDFESDLGGWYADASTLTQSAGSMLVEGDGGWKIAGKRSVKDFREILGITGAKITMDVTAFPDDMTTPWMNAEIIINGQNNDDNGPHNNIGWKPLGGKSVNLDGVPQTLEFELPDELTSAIAGTDETIAWFEFALISNIDGASNSKFYVDNITIIPEPMTMSLLGLGGLVLLRRKRSL